MRSTRAYRFAYLCFLLTLLGITGVVLGSVWRSGAVLWASGLLAIFAAPMMSRYLGEDGDPH